MRRPSILLLAAMGAALALPPDRPTLRADESSEALEAYRPRVDKMVDAALKYLAAHQDKTGHFPADGGRPSTAVTSLAVMAFLAKGHTPGVGPYGEAITRGVDWVLGKQAANGMLVGGLGHGPMYEHCIATLMLSEVSGMVDAEQQKRIDRVLPEATKVILAAQQLKRSDPRQQGGWRYQPNSRDSDISCTGWALMALRSARNNGARIPKEAIDEAVTFVLNCRDVSGAKPRNDPDRKPDPKRPGVGFCYQPGSSAVGQARTGTAVLCLELCGKHRCGEALDGGDWILAHPYKSYGDEFFYYGLYYCSQAMFQLGGAYWETYAPSLYEMMEKFQAKDGSWPKSGANEATAGTNYSTAMGVLAISMTYRQLPIYQR